MELIGLQTDCVAIHGVFQRRDDRTAVTPNYGTTIVELSGQAREHFHSRIVAAAGMDAKCMEMSIARHGDGTTFRAVRRLLDCGEDAFADASSCLADYLSTAQSSRRIPGGLLVVFRGAIAAPHRRVVGIIKAEKHEGFRKRDAGAVQYFDDLFLEAVTDFGRWR